MPEKQLDQLALFGGRPYRDKPYPGRRLFDVPELEAVKKVFEHSWANDRDFGYQGYFEEQYTAAFCRCQGGGFADGVSSGTAAVFVALSALGPPVGAEIIVSPITDPGSISPIILSGCIPVAADAAPGGLNLGPDQLAEAITDRTFAIVLTHTAGRPVDMDPVMALAAEHGLKVVEDCSQAHGALYKGRKVGSFGDAAAFSTMFSKQHATGGCGGLVYTRNQELYNLIRAASDRGKAFHDPNFNPKNPGQSLMPALNFNLDELSCAIGLSTLAKLDRTIDRRLELCDRLDAGLADSVWVKPSPRDDRTKPSFFFYTLEFDIDAAPIGKEEFARAVLAEGVPLNPHYLYAVAEWPWMGPYLKPGNQTPNAVEYRNRSFNILFHERFSESDMDDIAGAIKKVEQAYGA